MVRVKYRYILTEVILEPSKHLSSINIELQTVYHAVKAAVLLMHGDYGEAVVKRSLSVKYINNETRIILIRVKRNSMKVMLQALTVVKKIGNWNAFFKTLHVSGTMRSSQKYLVMHQKKELMRLLSQCKNSDEKKKLRKMIHSCEQSCKERTKMKKRVLIPISMDSEDEIDSEEISS